MCLLGSSSKEMMGRLRDLSQLMLHLILHRNRQQRLKVARSRGQLILTSMRKLVRKNAWKSWNCKEDRKLSMIALEKLTDTKLMRTISLTMMTIHSVVVTILVTYLLMT